jgi:hypothetical protein
MVTECLVERVDDLLSQWGIVRTRHRSKRTGECRGYGERPANLFHTHRDGSPFQ